MPVFRGTLYHSTRGRVLWPALCCLALLWVSAARASEPAPSAVAACRLSAASLRAPWLGKPQARLAAQRLSRALEAGTFNCAVARNLRATFDGLHGHGVQLRSTAAADASRALERALCEAPAAPAPGASPLDACASVTTAVLGWLELEWKLVPRGVETTPEWLADRVAGLLDAPAEHLAGLFPTHPDYQALVRALGRYRAVVALGGWSDWPLARRLAFDGWLESQDADPAVVSHGLRAFQAANGLDASGTMDENTRAALEVSASHRLDQVQAALERWRRSPSRGHATYVRVNIAAAEAELWREGARVLLQRALVGAPTDPTPRTDRAIDLVQLNPPWFVPRGVEVNELEGYEANAPGFYERNGFRVSRNGNGARRLVQAPGPANWLGRAIFRWEASDNIYIHGSPFVERFAKPRRALSHGCVNLEDVVGFASALLGAVAHPDAQRLPQLVRAGGGHKLRLATSVPAFLEYVTVSADSSGRLRFHPDVYGHDEQEIFAHDDGRIAIRQEGLPVDASL